jgi:hypothetical protein
MTTPPERLGGFAVAPADTRRADLAVDVTTSGPGVAILSLPFIAPATDDQAALSPFAPPADDRLAGLLEAKRFEAGKAIRVVSLEARDRGHRARITTSEGVIAVHGERLLAYFERVLEAGGAVARMVMRAIDANGVAMSDVYFDADEFAVGVAGSKPFRVEGGVTYIEEARIKKGAVTDVYPYSQSGVVNLGYNTETTIATIAGVVVGADQEVNIWARAGFFVASSGGTGTHKRINVYLYLYRDGALVSPPNYGVGDYEPDAAHQVEAFGSGVLMLTDQPAPGTYTYTLKAKVVVNWTSPTPALAADTCEGRNMQIITSKK